MVVRLAFSMFACFDPDVLIVDEALSVGDIYFQQKCVRRIQQLLGAGLTMLFVSHDAVLVQRLCSRAVLLTGGQVRFIGPPSECMNRYYGQVGAGTGAGNATGSNARGTAAASGAPRDPAGAQAASESPSDREPPTVEPEVQQQIRRYNVLNLARARHGQGGLVLEAATFETGSGPRTLSVPLGGVATLRLLLRANVPIAEPHAGLHLYDRVNNLIFAAGTRQLGGPSRPMCAGELRLVTFRLTFCVEPGQYTLTLGCSEPSDQRADLGTVHDRHEGIGPIVVTLDLGAPRTFFGLAQLPMEVIW